MDQPTKQDHCKVSIHHLSLGLYYVRVEFPDAGQLREGFTWTFTGAKRLAEEYIHAMTGDLESWAGVVMRSWWRRR